MGRILIVGSSNTDMVIRVPKIPQPGETVLGGEFSMIPGGKGANQAVAAARAGGEVTFITKVGNDAFGKKTIDGLKSDGVNINYIFKDGLVPSGVAFIFVNEKGENSIAVAPGANYSLSPADIESSKYAFSVADILIMQLEIPIETVFSAAKIANQNGMQVILNPAPARNLDDSILKNISVLIPNETETEILTGVKINDKNSAMKASEFLLNKGIDTILITMGSLGVFAATTESFDFVPAFKVRAVDTTAAGDIFIGNLAVSLAENISLLDSVKNANAAAAISVTRFGAQPSAPYRKEIEDFLRTN